MAEQHTTRTLLAECALIVDGLVGMIEAAKEAFAHQQIPFLVDLTDRHDKLDIGMESCRRAVRSVAVARGEEGKESRIRLQSILNRLQAISDAVGRLGEPLRKQIRDGVLFSDKAASQVKYLLDRQGEILRGLGSLMSKFDEGGRLRVVEGCQEIGRSCLEFAEEHEDRLVEGICPPQAAPLFLAIIDHTQTIIHHESNIANLLRNKF